MHSDDAKMLVDVPFLVNYLIIDQLASTLFGLGFFYRLKAQGS